MHVDWDFERSYASPFGTVQLLKRILADLPEAIRLDLPPFLDLATLARYDCEGKEPAFHRGVLHNIKDTSGVLEISFDTGGGQYSIWNLRKPVTTVLSVWRVNNQLDALQCTFTGSTERLYLQTGGERLLQLFERASVGTLEEIANAQAEFLHTATGERQV